MRKTIASLILISLPMMVTGWVWAGEQEEIATVVSTLQTPIPEEWSRLAQFADQNRERHWGKDVSQEWSRQMARVNAIVQGIGGKMWTARILDAPQVNAFTIGGPYFYIYTGLLPSVPTNDALAFVIAHEMSHTLLKHPYQKRHANLAQLEQDIAKQGERNADRQEGKDMITHAGKIATAAFTRDQEEQADALATILCLQHGYDPEQGKEFFVDLAFHQELPKALGVAWLRGLKELTKPDPLEDCRVYQAECQQREQARKAIEAQQRQRREWEWYRDHPANPNRVFAITALTRHLRGSGSLDEVRKYHQTYIVLEAFRSIQTSHKEKK